MNWVSKLFKKKNKVAIVRLEGTIAPSMTFGAGLNDQKTFRHKVIKFKWM